MGGDFGPQQSLLDRARAALDAGDALTAIVELTSIVKSDPANAEAWEWLGVAQHRAGNLESARGALERAIVLVPQRARAHLHLARILRQLRELDTAVQEVQAALLLDPLDPDAQRLQQELAQDIRSVRDHTSDGFAVVKPAPNPLQQPPGAWARIPCPVCGFRNFITARTCARCGSLLPEGEDVRPVE